MKSGMPFSMSSSRNKREDLTFLFIAPQRECLDDYHYLDLFLYLFLYYLSKINKENGITLAGNVCHNLARLHIWRYILLRSFPSHSSALLLTLGLF